MEYLQKNDIVRIKKDYLSLSHKKVRDEDYLVIDIRGLTTGGGYTVDLLGSDTILENVSYMFLKKIGHLTPIWLNGEIVSGEVVS